MTISLTRLITGTTELCKLFQGQVSQAPLIHPWLCEGHILGAEAEDLGASGERENLGVCAPLNLMSIKKKHNS